MHNKIGRGKKKVEILSKVEAFSSLVKINSEKNWRVPCLAGGMPF